MTDGQSRSGASLDPLVSLAERLLAQRLVRYETIDAALLGEPAWDILLLAFIETGKGGGCKIDELGAQLALKPPIAERWITILKERDMLIVEGNMLVLSPKSEVAMRSMLRNQVMDLMCDNDDCTPSMNPQ